MSISTAKLEPFDVYEPFLAVIKGPLPGILVCAVFAYIAFFLLRWLFEPGKDLERPQGRAGHVSASGQPSTKQEPHRTDLVEGSPADASAERQFELVE
ncbi:hypothetical protein [Arthrobacter sp. HY1533]|uniref:hypothetical protein n=1 Tax=Arthrobacter sp. HY1533 TaxID=2970919 RepID=UPI0022BA06CD|nr:hypothetical protein [Arthrobacter sp. HY1533]